MKTTQDQFAHRATAHARALADGRPVEDDCGLAQEWLTAARDRLLDAFSKSSDPAPLLRLIEDLAIIQERLSAIKE